MLEIDDKIVSLDIIREGFCCDIAACRGECCVQGNAGAPLEQGEEEVLRVLYPLYKDYMKPAGIAAVERDGFAVLDADGDLTTPLVDDAECAYSFVEDGITLCAIERAWLASGGADAGSVSGSAALAAGSLAAFPKPISCHLYPIRVSRFSDGSQGLNYHRWSICSPARRSSTPVYRALRAPLVRAFGEEFFHALEEAEQWLMVNG